jgi:hypothetical protein
MINETAEVSTITSAQELFVTTGPLSPHDQRHQTVQAGCYESKHHIFQIL